MSNSDGWTLFIAAVLCVFWLSAGHALGYSAGQKDACQESCQLSGYDESRWVEQTCECLEIKRP